MEVSGSDFHPGSPSPGELTLRKPYIWSAHDLPTSGDMVKSGSAAAPSDRETRSGHRPQVCALGLCTHSLCVLGLGLCVLGHSLCVLGHSLCANSLCVLGHSLCAHSLCVLGLSLCAHSLCVLGLSLCAHSLCVLGNMPLDGRCVVRLSCVCVCVNKYTHRVKHRQH